MKTMTEISDIPFVFMRGVKLEGQDIDDFDMMRSEETELMALILKEKTVKNIVELDKKQLIIQPQSVW